MALPDKREDLTGRLILCNHLENIAIYKVIGPASPEVWQCQLLYTDQATFNYKVGSHFSFMGIEKYLVDPLTQMLYEEGFLGLNMKESGTKA